MIELDATLKNVEQAFTELRRVAKDVPKASRRALTRIARIAHREARKNAPHGPSASQIKAKRKTKRKVKRKNRAYSRPAPGGLERSLAYTADQNEAVIFVAANSEAGKYGYRLHEEKGLTWKKRGPGTQAKGARADDKFITRAVINNEGNFLEILTDEVKTAVAG